MRRLAVVVGCKHYEDELIADLKYADKDADRFERILLEKCGFQADGIVTLNNQSSTDRAPTRRNTLRALAGLASVSQRDSIDLLVFFFSGHGFQSGKDRKQYLLCSDSIAYAIEDSALSFESMLKYIERANAKHILFFIDACRSVIADAKSPPDLLSPSIDVNQLCPSGMVSFCSSSPGEASFDSEKVEAGLFTFAIVEAFSESNRCQTVYELEPVFS